MCYHDYHRIDSRTKLVGIKMAAFHSHYIDRSLRYIFSEIETKDKESDITISGETLLRVSRSLRISGLFQMADYHKLIKQLEEIYKDKTVNYTICSDGRFLNLNFLELRNK